ncbi:hypothetical protein R1sor_018880 [Riccia sorocarpa]|uniref:glucose-6-phosphate 1-epimerase n=1 Tax=Riccia sorocarpa TaxID=122646 RepID=A0ABD3IB12_9MARC
MNVHVEKDPTTGFEKVILKEPRGSSAQVLLYGGQVTSWKNERGEELLFLSSKAIYKSPKAVRGGIPVCFPQFGGGSQGSLEQHGFARNRLWRIVESSVPLPGNNDAAPVTSINSSNKAIVELLLTPTEDDQKIWPHNFELRLRVALSIGGDLTMTAKVKNIDSKPFNFTFALHTYLSVADITEVRVEGLETLDYYDNLDELKRSTEQGDALTFDTEFDRVYLSTPNKIAVIDHKKKRTFILKKDGLPDAVVWNPWERKAKLMADFGDEEYKYMLCVEAAAVEKPISLKPGEEWTGRQELSAVSSSYFSGQLDPRKVVQGSSNEHLPQNQTSIISRFSLRLFAVITLMCSSRNPNIKKF